MRTLKTIGNFTYATLLTVFYFIVYVADNLICAFGLNTKLPFIDFVKTPFARTLAYRRVLTIIVLYFIYWLIF